MQATPPAAFLAVAVGLVDAEGAAAAAAGVLVAGAEDVSRLVGEHLVRAPGETAVEQEGVRPQQVGEGRAAVGERPRRGLRIVGHEAGVGPIGAVGGPLRRVESGDSAQVAAGAEAELAHDVAGHEGHVSRGMQHHLAPLPATCVRGLHPAHEEGHPAVVVRLGLRAPPGQSRVDAVHVALHVRRRPGVHVRVRPGAVALHEQQRHGHGAGHPIAVALDALVWPGLAHQQTTLCELPEVETVRLQILQVGPVFQWFRCQGVARSRRPGPRLLEPRRRAEIAAHCGVEKLQHALRGSVGESQTGTADRTTVDGADVCPPQEGLVLLRWDPADEECWRRQQRDRPTLGADESVRRVQRSHLIAVQEHQGEALEPFWPARRGGSVRAAGRRAGAGDEGNDRENQEGGAHVTSRTSSEANSVTSVPEAQHILPRQLPTGERAAREDPGTAGRGLRQVPQGRPSASTRHLQRGLAPRRRLA